MIIVGKLPEDVEAYANENFRVGGDGSAWPYGTKEGNGLDYQP